MKNEISISNSVLFNLVCVFESCLRMLVIILLSDFPVVIVNEIPQTSSTVWSGTSISGLPVGLSHL